MSQMGFGDKWILWIKGFISSSRASIPINGSATRELSLSKGVRQGDPLSPFLFIIAMEGLNVAMRTASQKSLFHGVKIPNDGPSVSHLFYAGDMRFVGDWTSSKFANFAYIVKCFHAASGLKVNFRKSNVFGIGISSNEVSSCARIVGCEATSFPFKYLGILVGANMNLKRNWLLIIEKVQSKLSAWKAKHLSLGGRLTLVKSFLVSLPLFSFRCSWLLSPLLSILKRFANIFFGEGIKEKIKSIRWPER